MISMNHKTSLSIALQIKTNIEVILLKNGKTLILQMLIKCILYMINRIIG